MRSESIKFLARMFLAAIALTACAGCAGGIDPYENVNRFFYNFNDGVDKVVLKPVSDQYVKFTPEPIRNGISNGFDNLRYFDVILNDYLQAKWNQGFGDTGRMAVNSTIGIGGILDVATPLGLPSHDNDFGITLGKWGVGPGPYLVVPLFGPSTLRDATRYGVSYVTDPLSWICLHWDVTIPLYAMETVDRRSRLELLAKFRDETAIDPYVYTRSAYLQYRQNRIDEGKTGTDQSLYDEDSGTEPATAPASTQPNAGHTP
jgi:phospholipid-binding lipoprotein MlaA